MRFVAVPCALGGGTPNEGLEHEASCPQGKGWEKCIEIRYTAP
jgi:hypothetical protein